MDSVAIDSQSPRTINLLVGKNNCGKTSILEAIHLLASGGNPSVLYKMAYQRGEILSVDEDEERYGTRNTVFADLSHFFNGHEFQSGSFFRIATENDLGTITISVVTKEDIDQTRPLFDELKEAVSPYALRFERTNHSSGAESFIVPVAETGAISPRVTRRPSSVRELEKGAMPVQFISPDSLEPLPMSQMWDRVLVEGKEEQVNSSMRILEPRLSNVQFLTSPNPFRSGHRGGVVIGLKDEKRRTPLGTYGDGMRRLLALSLSWVQTNGGLLLVDEIDTGFHYSIMGEMW